jgi:hypothetical protein
MQIYFNFFVQEKHVLFQASMCSLNELNEKTNHMKISMA